MATTLGELKAMLESENLEAYTNGEDAVLLAMNHEGQTLNISVRLMEDGAAIRWRIPFFLQLPTGRRRQQVLVRLLERNLVLKFLKFCLDPNDGEISLEMSFPLMDGTLTLEQVRRCLYAFYYTAVDERAALLKLIRTGEYPQDTPDQVEDSVRRLFEASGASEDEWSETPDEDAALNEIIDELDAEDPFGDDEEGATGG